MKMQNIQNRGRLAALLAGVSLLATSAVAAEEVKTVTDDRAIFGEIIVSAKKRDQRLRDVSTSVSAFTNDDILNRGVTTLDAMQASIPGIRLVDIGPGAQRIQLRGVAQYQGLPTVGNYLDEFSLNNRGPQGAPEIRLLDMERVEVLRGPQPVLYGEGSMGGTIRYVTKDPDLEEFGGNATAEVNSIKDGGTGWRAEGVLNVPLSEEKAGLRLAIGHNDVAGWVDGPLGEDQNDRVTTTVRGKLLFNPNEDLTVKALVMYSESEQEVKSYSFDGFNSTQGNLSPSRQEYTLATLEIAYDLGGVELMSSTGYVDGSGRSVDDSTGFYEVLFGGPLLTDVLSDSIGSSEKWEQEFRLTSTGDGPFQYLFGVSYTDFSAEGDLIGDAEPAFPGIIPGQFGVVFDIDSITESEMWAFYGDISYDLTDALTLEIGGRYFRDKITVGSAQTLFDLLPTGDFVTPFTSQEATFDTFNPRVSLTAKTGDSGIVYASAAKGFRSGGFNNAPQALVDGGVIAPTVEPEKLWTYELGAKQSLADEKVFIEFAVYYNDYNDIQLNQFVPEFPTRAFVLNGGEASGFGVDFILQALPREDLSITATVGWNDLRFDSDSADKLTDDPADLVPDWNLSASIDYTPVLSENMDLLLHADIGYVDSAQITLRSLEGSGLQAITPTQSRTIFNTRVGLTFSNGVQTYVYANNLFNDIKIVNPAFGAFFEPIFTQPRTIGLGVRTSF